MFMYHVYADDSCVYISSPDFHSPRFVYSKSCRSQRQPVSTCPKINLSSLPHPNPCSFIRFKISNDYFHYSCYTNLKIYGHFDISFIQNNHSLLTFFLLYVKSVPFSLSLISVKLKKLLLSELLKLI